MQQSQYMLQIVKCNDQSSRKFRTNYLTYFPERFLPPPMPLKSMVDGMEISEGKFGSLFQAISSAKYVDICFGLTSFVLLCKRCTKKGKTLFKNAHVGSVVKTTQPSRQSTLTKERAMGMKVKRTVKSPRKMKMKRAKKIKLRWSLLETTKLMKLFTCRLICVLCYTLYVRCKLI